MFVAPPGYQPVYNPCIPYIGPINGGLRSGMSIYIQGVIPHHVTRFHMSLMCAEVDGSDVGFHISPCFQGWDKVVFNHFEGGRWGLEEKTHHMPFRKGEAFEMVITVIQEGYQVKVNGKHFHSFNHRLAIERICALQIGGDVSIQTINVIGGGFPAGGYPGGQMGGGYPGGMAVGMAGGMAGGMGGGYPGGMAGGMGGGMPVVIEGGMAGGMGVVMEGGMAGGMGGGYPGGVGGGMAGGYPGGPGGYPGGPGGYPGGPGGYPGGPGGYPGGNMPMMIGQPIFNPTVPYSSLIPGGMSHKKTIIIRGMIPSGANRFSVNFIVGRSRDIPFHMNFRVRDGEVVRNSMLSQIWGAEEREYSFNPFQEGQFFELSIRCGNQRFKVFVNGQHLCNFFHRYQHFHHIDLLEVDGDVQISYIHF